MKRILVIILILSSLLAGWANLYANSGGKVGTAGAQFLKLGVGARYTAMGGASVATVSDGYSMYWNPAAMGVLQQTHLEFNNIQWIDGVNLNYFAFAKPGQIGTFGVSVTALSSGDIERTTPEYPDGTGDFYSTASYSVSVGYARQMTQYFAFGLSAKYVSERISEEYASGVAFDFGTILITGFKNLRIGMNISNLGPELTFSGPELDFKYNPSESNESFADADATLNVSSYNLPLIFRIGAAYDIHYSPTTRMTVAAEARDPVDNHQQVSFGGEVAFSEHLFLRGGYRFNYEEEGLSLGGGLNLPIWQSTDLNINYAWADFGRLESTHRISVGFSF